LHSFHPHLGLTGFFWKAYSSRGIPSIFGVSIGVTDQPLQQPLKANLPCQQASEDFAAFCVGHEAIDKLLRAFNLFG
jgi:hypothetical protein